MKKVFYEVVVRNGWLDYEYMYGLKAKNSIRLKIQTRFEEYRNKSSFELKLFRKKKREISNGGLTLKLINSTKLMITEEILLWS